MGNSNRLKRVNVSSRVSVTFQTSLNLGVQRNSYFDVSDSDSSLSDDEDDQRASEKVKKGKVTRTGFMLKKVSWSIHYRPST